MFIYFLLISTHGTYQRIFVFLNRLSENSFVKNISSVCYINPSNEALAIAFLFRLMSLVNLIAISKVKRLYLLRNNQHIVRMPYICEDYQ